MDHKLAEVVADPDSRDRSVVQRHVDETVWLLGGGGGGSSSTGSHHQGGCRVSGCTESHSRH